MKMILQELIECLERLDPNKTIPRGFNKPHSYRGDYSQLAFEPAKNITIGEMLNCAKEAHGTTYEGYKGGKYKMEDYTDVYIAEYGCTGEELGLILLNCLIDR